MAVEVILTIASVGSWIAGSGTLSTRTSRLPCHVSAFIEAHLVLSGPADDPCSLVPYPPAARANRLGAAVKFPGDRLRLSSGNRRDTLSVGT